MVIDMKYLRQLMIILGITFVGELLHYFLPLPVPASIYGLVILFLLLLVGVLQLENVEDTADFFLSIMPIFFISPSVSLMNAFKGYGKSLPAILITLVLSTIVVMAVTGVVSQLIIRYRKSKESDDYK